ncbi:MAG: aspartate aminotransferase family protein [Planctomycetia bacterium]|nr:aspartate aminotransferase family protein [Planctomycetia bacterium]
MKKHLSTAETIALFQKYVVANYNRYPVSLVRGEGSLIWDAEGKRYIDFFPGWGCNLLGHSPSRIVKAVQEQVAELIHVPNTWYMEAQGLLAKELSERSGFGGQCFFCNSGAEANETAIKLARLHGQGKRYKIITMEGGFHGRTMGAVSATAQPKYHQSFQPMLPGFTFVPFGNLDAVKNAIDAETSAILVEPIQGEGGIRIPPQDYLSGLRKVADQHNLLLMFDEVQAGMGRTGQWFGYQNFGVTPDVMTLAKSLAGGMAMGAVVARAEVGATLKPGMHACTFGGNPVAARAALAYIETIEQEQLLQRAITIGSHFKERFSRLQKKCSLIRDVRILGCMIGIELDREGTTVVQQCLDRHLLVNCTQGNVIRLLPALNLHDKQLEEGCQILEDVLQSLSKQG